MKYFILFLFFVSSFISFSQTKSPSQKNVITTGCQIVEKDFIGKGGKASGVKEMYLRCSIQDYFIKFCESTVSKKRLKKYIDKGLTVTYEIRDGEWDICEGDSEMQSRIGTYVIILSIKEKKKPKRKGVIGAAF